MSLGPAPDPPSFGGCAESQISRCEKTHLGAVGGVSQAQLELPGGTQGPGAIAGQHGPSSWNPSSYCAPGSAPPDP